MAKYLNITGCRMPNCPDIEYSFEYQLHRRLLEQRDERRHSRNIDVDLAICVLKALIPLNIVILLHQIPIIQPLAF